MIKTQEKSDMKKFVVKSWGFVPESRTLDNKPKKREKKSLDSDD